MNLYSRRRVLASATVLLAGVLVFTSVKAQRRTPHKLRATALVEVTTDAAGIVATRVFPITILDEGRFWDASVYKATPRPMALENGIVYETQQSGTATGYATIVNGVNNSGWMALGKWQPVTAAKKTEPPPPPIVGDGRPILHHGDTAATPAPPAATPAATPDQPSSPGPEDSERPVLRRRAPEKPEQPPAATPAPAAEATAPHTKLPVYTAGTKTFVGVSDNQPLDARTYDFVWKPGEAEQMEAKLRKLALAQLPRENAQLTANSLKNVQIRSFDLDLSNDAVMVLTAEVPGSYLANGSNTGPGKFVSRYITLIARVDFDGVPRKLSSSVTDSSRLDVAPRLELIDAVDVDGDGLAELLFREYSFDQTSFIIYGIGRSTVTKVFEGASTRLK
jgi:hypothetical protein